jgi:hypothetical protein
MRNSSWMGWLSIRGLFTSRGSGSRRSKTTTSMRPWLETLEDRLVPTMLDLTTVGAIGSLGGDVSGNPGIFEQNATQPSGSGVIDSFVRLQAKHPDSGIAQGYNTDARPVQFDEKISPVFTRSLLLSDVPEISVGGTLYYEFLLDINQTNSTPLLSLDELRFYVAGVGNLTGYDPSTNLLSGIAPSFDLGAGNWIELNSGLNPGSGIANMVALIPNSAFAGAPTGSYLYLYSKFGVNLPAHGGYEQWAVSTALTAETGFISGTVFNDLNDDGVFDAGDVGLQGWTVTITDSATGLSATTTTDANGDYLFQNLATGLGQFSTYTISVVPISPSWTLTTLYSSFTFSFQTPGQSQTNVDFGYIQSGGGGGA